MRHKTDIENERKIYQELFFFFWQLLEPGTCYVDQTTLASISHTSTHLCLLSASIKRVCYHTLLKFSYYKKRLNVGKKVFLIKDFYVKGFFFETKSQVAQDDLKLLIHLPSTGIIDVFHHTWLINSLLFCLIPVSLLRSLLSPWY